MNDLMLTFPIEKKEFDGQMVVTLKDIDTLHQRKEGTAWKNFDNNRKHFIEGVDFYHFKEADLQNPKVYGFEDQNPKSFGFEIGKRGTLLFTQTGYLMIVKSFTDDLSWEIQRRLVNGYFAAQRAEMTFMGTPVVTLMEAARALNIPYNTLTHRFTAPAIYSQMRMGDALLLEGRNLAKFKAENARCYIASSALWILTQSGFDKLRALANTAVTPRISKQT